MYAALEMAEPLHFLGRFNHILTFPVRLEQALLAAECCHAATSG
jgi:hypothetical protein